MEKIWKDVRDYEGYYQISNLGRLKALDRYVEHPKHGIIHKKEAIKKQWKNEDGYLYVKLSKNGQNINRPVHILVAQAFLGYKTYEDGFEVNHIDFDRTNNVVTNLEWVTHQENLDHSAAHGRYKRFGEANSNYGNDTLKKRFAEHPELRALQGRKGKQNGRCVPVILRNQNTNEELRFDYLREAARYLINNHLTERKHTKNFDVLASKLAQCIKTNSLYNGYQILHA